MRADLQALIDYTGLSNGETANLLGIGHEALSRKLTGKPRYDVRQDEIQKMLELAGMQDRAVAATLGQIDRLNREHPVATGEEPNEVVLISYRATDDMLPGEEWPTASAHRMVLARVKHGAAMNVHLIAFDRADYAGWLSGRKDSRSARLEWANQRASQGTRFSIKWGLDKDENGRVIHHGLGWCVWRTGRDGDPNVVYRKLAEGDTDIS